MNIVETGVRTYNRQTLFNLNNPVNNIQDGLRETLRELGLLREPGLEASALPGAGGRRRGHRKRCARKRKRGKRAGVRARLKTNPSRPALPSIILSNVCSLDNELDYIRLQQATQREVRDCCVFVFTETWLSDRVPDPSIQLNGLASFRADRNAALCGKTRGGGLCVYINTKWCKNSVLVSSYCSSLVEFVTVRCRPFYLPREFTTVFIIGVYIPPGANAEEALWELYTKISDLQNTHPYGLFIVAGDFNHANLKSVLPRFHHYVDFATRGENTLDLVYTNIPGAYRAEPRPHLAYSDHISVMLIPAYRPLVRRSKPVLKQVKTWPAGAISALQDCFESTDWNMFREAATHGDFTDLEEYTSSVSSYINKCTDDVTVSKTIISRPNQKPWITAEVRALLRTRDSAFKAGDKVALRRARAELSRAIREAKRAHAQRIHNHFKDSGVNPRKAAGPDNIPGRVLRECAEQLADVLTDIFNISLSSAVVPTCFKATTIVPVPKKSSVSGLNDYRPVALTPTIMKCFERLVMKHIKTLLPPHWTHCNLHFSSAFNTIIPQQLIGKLSLLGLNTSLCNWILDFLTGRPQSVRIGNCTSSTTTLSTGVPQGCVLSPLLFTLLTHDCVATHSSNHIIKFADDTTVVGLISKNDESAYREEVQRLTDWCKDNNLSLNVDKTKEMVVDFRRTRGNHSPLSINGSSVEIVDSTKFLGVHLEKDLGWSLNTSSLHKKAQQRLFFLRGLRKAQLPPPILTTFYRGTIESILSGCITVWFGNCATSDRKTLQRIVGTAEKIIGVSLPSIEDIYTTRCIRKATSIVADRTHPSHTLFTLLPSGKRTYVKEKLRNKFQQKLSPADFLQIHPPVKRHHVTSEKDLAQTFLHRLMMLDYRARYIPLKAIDTDHTEQTHVHPMDVQMAVFHCSDSFLKQMMITKLSQCQYALPLLVLDPVTMEIECPLWTFRQITKTWKVTDMKNGSNIMKSVPVCKARTHLVSFFRLGSLSVSKSQLMNTLINDRHSTFFHRNCPGSTKSRYLMDGVAEIAWYCPAGKPNDAFNDCIAFCNLRGDALLIEKQRDILIEKSSINIFLVASLQEHEESQSFISALFKSHKPLVCLCVDDRCGGVKTKKGKYKMGLKDRSQSDISEELKQIISDILFSLDGSRLNPSFQLETMAELSEIKVDESDPFCQIGKSAAMKIMDLLTADNMDVSHTFLPCQGHLWHRWSKIHKELYHLRGDIEKEKSKKQQELMKIRQKQCAVSCSKLIQLFIESLSSLPPKDKEYFLKLIQILMDALSTDELPVILKSYDEKWSEVLALKNKHMKSDLLIKKQTELEEISKKLQSATFGLEHIFREMGQIYEAHGAIERDSRHTDWSKYPEVAAQLMISGHPMELIDGDAGHVSLTWISSLLEEVIKKLGDQRVFVLSVLGIKSSGKSTMLNTMFGLQFAVSAGRCTKGAFMQLLKVSEEMKKDLKFDYLLVVDTEGLRALELEGNITLHHNNELATFVVGLGNLTLINIFGENPSEMQDILQIVVQAFMRMKKVQLSPSCVFVHQNVTDVAAVEKNMDGRRRLQEKLDQMAKLAAEEEVCSAECFSDVIEFDVQKDVKYCAQLWEGSPPMAPPNPGYSESIQEVKNTILSGITLLQFKNKIQDLWSALLTENFVFSFKNTLEIAAYRKLEAQYGNWTWALRSNMLAIENQLHNRIENGNLDKVDLSDLKKESDKTYETIAKEMTTYFEEDKEKEMLAQWRGRFETKIKEFHDEQVSTVKRKLDEVIQQKKTREKLDDKKKEFEDKLLQKSKELAQQLKDKAKDEEELNKQFSSVWRDLVTELTADIKPVEDIDLKEDQFIILQELGFEETLINERKGNGRYKKLSHLGDYSDYVKQTKVLGIKWPLNALSYENQQQIISLIERAEIESLDAIKSKPVATRGYKLAYLQETAKQVKQEVDSFQKEGKCALKKEFTVDLILYVFSKSESWILDSLKTLKSNNDIVTYLESTKTQYYNVFRSFCKGSSSAVVLAELICEKLKASTLEAVCNKTAIGLAGEMRCNFPAFNGNRLNLEKHVLKSLAEFENFDDFITYIRNPRRQTEAFIKAQVKKYIFTGHKDETVNVLKNNVDDVNSLVSRALSTATQKVQTQTGDINMWLKEFSSLLKDELTLDTISSQNFSDINNFDFFMEAIKKEFTCIIHEMSSLSLEKLKESRLKPDEILIDQLCNCCWVTCPFCAAVCTNTIGDHSDADHSVPFHRPEGIKGWHYRDTVEFSINFCTTNVASDGKFYPRHDSEETVPYKLYRTAGPEYADWRITYDESKLVYWKWFVCRFQKKLEEHYNYKFQGRGEILSEWKTISKCKAIRSLDEMCE
ncbi:interferon-induced very large GTPase 1-like [Pelmatolapia mariae]|uniref:interferon-induced very large GTPase 1-like n=1 Tax=Pelmatolapia mariae TaxID=158779 RepID=UPI002FE5FB3B